MRGADWRLAEHNRLLPERALKFLSFPELKSLKGIPYTRRHLRDLCKDGKFPQPVEVSEARIAWVEEEVDQWQAAKAAARRIVEETANSLPQAKAGGPKPAPGRDQGAIGG
jgi:predicted DNA-binding transcriptional regulator AlpA